MPVTVTITLSDKHAAAINQCDFDGHAAPSDITEFKERVKWLLESLCEQTLVDEAYARVMLHRRLGGSRD